MNKPCLEKLFWKFYKGEKESWCNVLQGKYGRKNLTGGVEEAKAQDPSLWKTLVKTWTLYGNRRMWTIGNGESVHAWNIC
ncbi:unnamed protein product [Lathyrus sativus]|nr:unnamed protein product [Lathyrus sativus]